MINETIEGLRKEIERSDGDLWTFDVEDVSKVLAEIERLRHAISWGVSCSGCSNQLAEEWDIIGGSFVCQDCIDYGGDSE